MRRLAQHLSLVLLGTIVGLLILELGLRLLPSPGEQARRATVFHPRWGTLATDSWIFEFQVPASGTVRVRERDYRVPKPASQTRVLFIGDSGTEGAFVPFEQSYPLRFESQLGRHQPGHDVRVINAGVWGMTTVDELHLLRDKLLALQPDVVVLGLFMSNDINFNLGHSSERRVRRAPHGWFRALRSGSALVDRGYLALLSLNARRRWFRPEQLQERFELPQPLRLMDRYGFHMLSYPAGETALYMKQPSPLVDRAFASLEELFRQFIELGEARGFRFRVVLIPAPSAVAGRLRLLHYPNIFDELRVQGVDVGPEQLDVGLPTRRVLGICQRLELTCVDPTARMQQLGMGVFFPTDEHPTAMGHAVIAEELLAAHEQLLAP